MKIYNSNKRFTHLISRVILLYSLIILPVNLVSQTYYFENYGPNEGLASSKVYCIIQDKDDYIWLGTSAGISRFDGVNFENFSIEDGLAPGGVKSISQSKSGTIWIGHLDGKITRYSNNEFEIIDTSIINNSKDITSIIEDIDNSIWFTTYGNGTFRIINPTSKQEDFVIENYKGGALSDLVFEGVFAFDSTLFLLTDFHIKQFIREEKRFINYLPKSFSDPAIWKTCMIEDKKGNLWIGSRNGGLFKMDKNGKDNWLFDYKDGLETGFIWTIMEDSRGNIWTSNIDEDNLKGGITRINEDGFLAFNKTNGLSDNKIQCITEDKEGNILLGTRNHGLSIYKGDDFINIFKEDKTNEISGLINEQVFAITQDNSGRFWFGTDRGITIFNPKSSGKKFTHINTENGLLHNRIRFLEVDQDGKIWIGSEGGGAFYYNPATNKFERNFFISELTMFDDKIVTSMVIDNKNQLWIGTNEGLGYYEINTGRGKRLRQSDGLSGNTISSLHIDNEGILWIGAQGKGITRYDDSKVAFTRLKSLSNLSPNSFYMDKKDQLWVGTEGQGLFILKGDSIIKHYTEKDGILSNLINLIDCDNKGDIYIGSNKGLNKFSLKDNKIYTYTKKNGFVGIETKKNASFKDNQGYLWFGTSKGVSKYNPNFKTRNKIEPLTHITKMLVNLEEREIVDGLKLNYNENFVTFMYNSICLTNPDEVRYRVMLEGADNDWQAVSDQQFVKYPFLPPGKYTFKLKAKNAYNVWNTEPVSFSFQIKPPFYKTWWFILICIIVGFISILSYIKIREKQLVKEKEILEGKVKERTIEIQEKNEELAMKNKDIMDSIEYAKRIQIAILPAEIPYDDTFILFMPKDIVSGDFYWLIADGNKEFLSAVDCTGHGVPGAFMSIVGHNSLTKIVREYKITKPSKILDSLNNEVWQTLHQKGGTKLDASTGELSIVKDGMDMALICYNKDTHILEYAGAFNPLFLIRDGELLETKANRFSIGRVDQQEDVFTNHEIEIKKGDTIYMFSDGFQDQFGGPKGKKFMVKNLKQLLVSIQDKTMHEQKVMLKDIINNWMNESGMEQIDDILIIGRRF